MSDFFQWVVAPREEALRFDTFLAVHFPSRSRREIAELIASGAVRLNGRPSKKGSRVRSGDIITALTALSLSANAALPIGVVYTDDALVVLDKAAGIPSVALRHSETDTAANFLVARFPETVTAGPRPLDCGLLHRLDTATSGLLLAARSPYAYAALREQFRARTVEKHYLALVAGHVKAKGHVGFCLAPSKSHGQHMRVVPVGQGQEVHTMYVPVASLPGHTLLHLTIMTGVRHQIRVHLAALGHPIVGDTRYGSSNKATRLFLHAEALAFTSPASGQRIRCTSPIPQDFSAFVEHLRHRRGE